MLKTDSENNGDDDDYIRVCKEIELAYNIVFGALYNIT